MAATDPSRWIEALNAATSVTESYGAVILPVTGKMISALPFTESLGRSFETFIKDGWYTKDERNRGVNLMKERGIVDDLDIFTFEEIKRHPYYQEFLAPHGLRWFGGVHISCGDETWCLSIQRTIAQGPFTAEEKRHLGNLAHRLSGAAAIAGTIGDATGSGALDAFDISTRGAALINRDGKIYRLNRTAERILRSDLKVSKGRLTANDPLALSRFEKAVAKLLNSNSAGSEPPIAFVRPGRGPLLVYPIKLSSMARNALAECQVVAVFIDTDLDRKPPTAALQITLNLTTAEARLAAELASGEPLERVADKLSVTKETARTQLKSIFSKTGCRRQSELVAILAAFLKS
ncbi:helix-turn-helix transcriptional regulator [Bradyrhizobium guangdongense]